MNCAECKNEIEGEEFQDWFLIDNYENEEETVCKECFNLLVGPDHFEPVCFSGGF